MNILDKLDKAEFMGGLGKIHDPISGNCDGLPCFGCDAGPLPPGCDCICHTPCHRGRADYQNSVAEARYEVSSANEVYEMN